MALNLGFREGGCGRGKPRINGNTVASRLIQSASAIPDLEFCRCPVTHAVRWLANDSATRRSFPYGKPFRAVPRRTPNPRSLKELSPAYAAGTGRGIGTGAHICPQHQVYQC
ncbi:hypothetical protein GCM10010245_35040 [Streptomyces spectabilis]|nr:hypothetical protein GCM10010245_35040 [Streptomyces spectabilis]